MPSLRASKDETCRSQRPALPGGATEGVAPFGTMNRKDATPRHIKGQRLPPATPPRARQLSRGRRPAPRLAVARARSRGGRVVLACRRVRLDADAFALARPALQRDPELPPSHAPLCQAVQYLSPALAVIDVELTCNFFERTILFG